MLFAHIGLISLLLIVALHGNIQLTGVKWCMKIKPYWVSLECDILALRAFCLLILSSTSNPFLNTANVIVTTMSSHLVAAKPTETDIYLRPKRWPHFMDTIRCDPKLVQFSKHIGHWHIDSSSELLSCVEGLRFLLALMIGVDWNSSCSSSMGGRGVEAIALLAEVSGPFTSFLSYALCMIVAVDVDPLSSLQCVPGYTHSSISWS